MWSNEVWKLISKLAKILHLYIKCTKIVENHNRFYKEKPYDFYSNELLRSGKACAIQLKFPISAQKYTKYVKSYKRFYKEMSYNFNSTWSIHIRKGMCKLTRISHFCIKNIQSMSKVINVFIRKCLIILIQHEVFISGKACSS